MEWKKYQSFKKRLYLFLFRRKIPKTLISFFTNSFPLNKKILQIEGRKRSVIEVLSVLRETLKLIKERMEATFLLINFKQIPKRGEISNNMKDKFLLEVEDLYSTSYN